ncbi:MAG: 23S rRNA pseudouridine(1911/1915/1917) synthase RluD [Candidatus Eutrophobiaceae bacterium]
MTKQANEDTLEASVPIECAGQRLDRVLALLFPDFSRTRLQYWVKEGLVRVNGATCGVRLPVAGGDQVSLIPRLDARCADHAEPIPLDILHQDEQLIVLNKPPGLVTHPGAGNRCHTLMNALLYYDPNLVCLPRAGIVHRLDKDTSGIMVIARTLTAHNSLTAALAERRIERHYQAIVCGELTSGGTINAPIGRHATRRTRMAVIEGGRPAVTHYRIMERFQGHTHIAVQLETGRTHQIRVHMAMRRHPVLGDPQYGGKHHLARGIPESLRHAASSFPRQALHAWRLRLPHPTDNGTMREWIAPMAPDMAALLNALHKSRESLK